MASGGYDAAPSAGVDWEQFIVQSFTDGVKTKYLSNRDSVWRVCTVVCTDAEGGVRVRLDGDMERTVSKQELTTRLQGCQKAEYFSSSTKEWLECVVRHRDPDGTVTVVVKISEKEQDRKVKKEELATRLRKKAEVPDSAAGGYPAPQEVPDSAAGGYPAPQAGPGGYGEPSPLQPPKPVDKFAELLEKTTIKQLPRVVYVGDGQHGSLENLELKLPGKEPEETVVAVDAIKADFHKYTERHLLFMLKEAYTGFVDAKQKGEVRAKRDGEVGAKQVTIVAGSWGCGVCYNNENVIFVIQGLAANLAGVSLIHRVLGDGLPVQDGFALLEDAFRRKTGGSVNPATVSQVLDALVKCCADDDFDNFHTKFDKKPGWLPQKRYQKSHF